MENVHQRPVAKPNRALFAAAIAASLLLVGAPSAQAILLFGNTPVGGGATTGVNHIFTTQWNAAQFTLGSSNYALGSVILNASNGNDGNGGLTVEIYDDTGTGGTAGDSLAVLTTSDTVGDSLSNLTYTALGDYLLSANTTYWIVAKGTLGPTGNNNTHVGTNTNAYSGVAEVVAASTDLTQYFCQDAGGDCFDDPITWTVSPGSPGGNHDMAFAVNGTAVSEPASIALLGLGMLGFGVRKRRSGAHQRDAAPA